MRHLFDIPEDVAYFNCAYYSPLLNESRRRLLDAATAKSHPWQRTTASFFDDAETIRGLAATLFGGDVNGYAIIPSVSYGVSTAARALEPTLGPGDRILVVAEEFPSNVLPWHRVAAERGAELVTVPTPADGDWVTAILPYIDRRVKVAALSTCHWTNGARIDLVPIAHACRDNTTVLVVDATQSLGAMPFAMDDVAPDFLIAAAYKWLLCPYGVALMHVGAKWRTSRPLEESWLARDNAHDFTSLAHYSDGYLAGARRFDVGEKATASLPGAIAALEQIRDWGIASIASRLETINAEIAATLVELRCEIPPASVRCPHMLGAGLPDDSPAAAEPGGVVSALRADQIYISQRGRSLRVAPHLYITPHDIERLTGRLAACIWPGSEVR